MDAIWRLGVDRKLDSMVAARGAAAEIANGLWPGEVEYHGIVGGLGMWNVSRVPGDLPSVDIKSGAVFRRHAQLLQDPWTREWSRLRLGHDNSC
jgi:hypothetical protein